MDAAAYLKRIVVSTNQIHALQKKTLNGRGIFVVYFMLQRTSYPANDMPSRIIIDVKVILSSIVIHPEELSALRG